jgi:hypothetical protein
MAADLTHEQYNYRTFSLAAHELLDRWDVSPPVGRAGPDYPLWDPVSSESTTLHALCREQRFLVAEFGSIT